MRLHPTFLAAAAALALCAAAPAAEHLGPEPKESPRPAGRDWNPRHTPVVDVVRRARDSVVNIHSERTVLGDKTPAELLALAPSQNRINGMGTGVVIDPRGYIITNQHVVEDVNLIRVRLGDGTPCSARVLARDAETDLALLKIDAGKPLPVMPLGTATDLMVGETVIAVGNAYGYEHTVTVGVVSAVKRDVTLNKEMSYKALIQTDASINPGNSGGPLLNVHGDLVGVNVAIRAGAQGIGFAIPVDTMIRVAADMLRSRQRDGGWHGLVCRDVVGEGDPVRPGTLSRKLVVDRAEAGSPAAKAGLQRGDVVTQVGDVAVLCVLDLERGLLERKPGDAVAVVVRRDGAEKRLELTLQAAEKPAGVAGDVVWRKLGLRLQPVSAELVSRTNQQLHGGLSVSEVRPEGVAAKAGIQRGDILVGLHTWEMLSLDNVLYVLNSPELASFNPLKFYIIRAGQVHRGWLQQLD